MARAGTDEGQRQAQEVGDVLSGHADQGAQQNDVELVARQPAQRFERATVPAICSAASVVSVSDC
ncbi:hypothetical protein [Streptomyces sp. NRRL F-2799]|uniref:hypothetical protein n=1 Tax=Streptomyces sp. NRRL F-2799 TaxID=1463844 RepID=UPI00131A5A5F|nr:hypothetical protein [Streptomyces sp. NRRL F-2799]